MITLIPAYGRDYKDAKTAKQDYHDGKDFIIADFSHPYDGKPCSIRDMQNEKVMLRFNRLTKTTVV
jgi:hypothetical protein